MLETSENKNQGSEPEYFNEMDGPILDGPEKRMEALGMVRGEPPKHKAQRLLFAEHLEEMEELKEDLKALKELNINYLKILSYHQANEVVLLHQIEFLKKTLKESQEKIKNYFGKDV